MLWGIVQTKGGVGKTTTAVYLATAAARAGYSARLIDTDPQGSAYDWAASAESTGDPLPFPVARTLKGLDRCTEDHVFVDTPPGNPKIIDKVLEAVDLVIIPALPSPPDIQRVWATLEVTGRMPTVVVLTGVNKNTRLLREIRTLFDEAGVPLAATLIPQREAIRHTYGHCPENLNNYDTLFDEIMEAING